MNKHKSFVSVELDVMDWHNLLTLLEHCMYIQIRADSLNSALLPRGDLYKKIAGQLAGGRDVHLTDLKETMKDIS
jgi:hypothetical protein